MLFEKPFCINNILVTVLTYGGSSSFAYMDKGIHDIDLFKFHYFSYTVPCCHWIISGTPFLINILMSPPQASIFHLASKVWQISSGLQNICMKIFEHILIWVEEQTYWIACRFLMLGFDLELYSASEYCMVYWYSYAILIKLAEKTHLKMTVSYDTGNCSSVSFLFYEIVYKANVDLFNYLMQKKYRWINLKIWLYGFFSFYNLHVVSYDLILFVMIN